MNKTLFKAQTSEEFTHVQEDREDAEDNPHCGQLKTTSNPELM